jgi:Protein of unknown function (DUF3563)
MSKLMELIQALLPRFPSQTEADEAYLAQAADLRDLERRVRQIDTRSRPGMRSFAPGLFPF